ncbi:hypothetical protein HY448_00885 [Candidatus Pacearchaeota archaeon]|nr:hypothetical protein [Candidatus Pacearchaeota archaeon]
MKKVVKKNKKKAEKKTKKKPREKSAQKETKVIDEKKTTNLENQLILNEEGFDIGRFAAGIKIPKAPVLERVTFQQPRNIQQGVQTEQTKKEDELKYGTRVDYGMNRTANKDREIRHQTATEYVTGKDEKRKFQGAEAFDQSMVKVIPNEERRNIFLGQLTNPNYEIRNEKRDVALARVGSEYEIKKRKYE